MFIVVLHCICTKAQQICHNVSQFFYPYSLQIVMGIASLSSIDQTEAISLGSVVIRSSGCYSLQAPSQFNITSRSVPEDDAEMASSPWRRRRAPKHNYWAGRSAMIYSRWPTLPSSGYVQTLDTLPTVTPIRRRQHLHLIRITPPTVCTGPADRKFRDSVLG